MKPIVLEFVGGYWDGKSLSTNSADQEERLLAAACYEMSHHGTIGAECTALSDDAVVYAQIHGWPTPRDAKFRGESRYVVSGRRETETAIVVELKHMPVGSSSSTAVS